MRARLEESPKPKSQAQKAGRHRQQRTRLSSVLARQFTSSLSSSRLIFLHTSCEYTDIIYITTMDEQCNGRIDETHRLALGLVDGGCLVDQEAESRKTSGAGSFEAR